MSLKSALKGVCNAVGVNERLVSRRRDEFLVLNYHGVVQEPRPERWSYENWDPASTFRAQLRWLKQWFTPVGLTGLREWKPGANGTRPPCLVTFDDGYRNNLTVAAPILKSEGVPALFFLATGYIGTDRTLWNDEIRVRIVNWKGSEIRLPGGGVQPTGSDVGERRTLSERVNRECKKIPNAEREAYIEYLRAETPHVSAMDDPEARAFMNWDEARTLAAMGFDIGSHTSSHPILSRISADRIPEEIQASKKMIERELGRSCESIAYPNGTADDVSEAIVEAVGNAGYEWGFMTTPVWHRVENDRYRIPRVGFPGHADLATFKFYLSGLHRRLSGAA